MVMPRAAWPGGPDVHGVTVQQAKTQLSQLLRRVEAGEEIVIRRGPERVALLVRAPAAPGQRQIWADLKGRDARGLRHASRRLRSVPVNELLLDTDVVV